MEPRHSFSRVLGLAALVLSGFPDPLLSQTDPLLRSDPATVSINLQIGAPPPAHQTLAITSTSPGASVSYRVTTETATGGDWLYVGPVLAGVTPGTLVVGVNPSPILAVASTGAADLPPGTYTGAVVLTPDSAPTRSLRIPVILNVTGAIAQLNLNPTSVTFDYQIGAALPAAQSVAISVSGGASLSFNVVTSSTEGNWLSVIPQTGTTPAALRISANPGSLRAGTYNGVITVAALGVSNSPQTINASLTVRTSAVPDPLLKSEPSAVAINWQIGAAPPANQTLTITSMGGPVAYRVTKETASGGDWLFVGPVLAGVTPGTLVVGVNPSPIVGPAATTPPPGTYTGAVVLTPDSAPTRVLRIPVTLTVTAAAAQLTVDPANLAFDYQIGSALPAAQSVGVSVSPGPSLNFAVVTSPTDGNWLSVTPQSGATPASLRISASPGSLRPGTYTGTVTITAPGVSNSPQTVRVSLLVGPPVPTLSSVVNAASFASGPVAPGEIITIRGSGLSRQNPTSAPLAGLPSSTSLAGVSVHFDETTAPLLYVAADQISAIVPSALADRSTTRLQVEVEGTRSAAVDVPVASSAPGIFSLNRSGTGPGAILNQDFSLNSDSNPAARGSIVMIYATGGGTTEPPMNDALLADDVLRRTVQPVSAVIGAQRADVLYAGSAPGLVMGLLQVNARVPEGIGPGQAVPVFLTVGGSTSQAGVTLAVK